MYENQRLVFSSKNNLSLTQTLQNRLLEMSVDRSKKEFFNTEPLGLCSMKVKYEYLELTEIALKIFSWLPSIYLCETELSRISIFFKTEQTMELINIVTEIALLLI